MRGIVLGIGFASFLVFFLTPAAHPQAGTPFPATQFPRNVQCPQPMEQQPRMAPVKVDVRVPTPYPRHRGNFYRGMGTCPAASRPSQPVPVRVEVQVKSAPDCRPELAPVAYRDAGPVRPLLTYGCKFVQAAISLPFRIGETICTLPSRKPCGPAARVCPPPCAPRAPRLVKCRVPARPAPLGPQASGYAPPFSCGPCEPPMACAPAGPSVAPLPRAGCPARCEPYLPARIVRDAEFPLLEPRDLMGGLVNLPFRLMQRGRFFGDWGKGSEFCGY
jgi:hypothetical protein